MYTQQIIIYDKIKNVHFYDRYWNEILHTLFQKKALVNVPEEGKIKRQEGKNVIIHLKYNFSKFPCCRIVVISKIRPVKSIVGFFPLTLLTDAIFQINCSGQLGEVREYKKHLIIFKS